MNGSYLTHLKEKKVVEAEIRRLEKQLELVNEDSKIKKGKKEILAAIESELEDHNNALDRINECLTTPVGSTGKAAKKA